MALQQFTWAHYFPRNDDTVSFELKAKPGVMDPAAVALPVRFDSFLFLKSMPFLFCRITTGTKPCIGPSNEGVGERVGARVIIGVEGIRRNFLRRFYTGLICGDLNSFNWSSWRPKESNLSRRWIPNFENSDGDSTSVVPMCRFVCCHLSFTSWAYSSRCIQRRCSVVARNDGYCHNNCRAESFNALQLCSVRENGITLL